MMSVIQAPTITVIREMMKVEKVGKSEKVLDRLRSEMDTLGRNGDRYVAGSDL